MDKNNIIWLASYPKSGNTWFRVFLTNVLKKDDSPANINKLIGNIASHRDTFDRVTGLSSSDMSPEEILNLRPEVYNYISRKASESVYQKIHDAFILTGNGKLLVPPEATKGVVYFIRNPLDVVISFANHLNKTIEQTIDIVNDEKYTFCSNPDQLHHQLEQKLLSWSSHVKSWTEKQRLKILVVKYEDMISDTHDIFKLILNFIGLEVEEKKLAKAIKNSSFEQLRKQEEEFGFNEKPGRAKSFFRKGKIDDWKNILTKQQIDKILEYHHETCEKFNYIK